jgi:osmotically-inducible protein OsmY
LQGVTHKATHPFPSAPADDHALADRVRSEALGRLEHAGNLNIDVVDRVVTLRGEVADPDEVNEIYDRVRRVPGVANVVNLLHPPGTPAPNKADVLSNRSS